MIEQRRFSELSMDRKLTGLVSAAARDLGGDAWMQVFPKTVRGLAEIFLRRKFFSRNRMPSNALSKYRSLQQDVISEAEGKGSQADGKGERRYPLF